MTEQQLCDVNKWHCLLTEKQQPLTAGTACYLLHRQMTLAYKLLLPHQPTIVHYCTALATTSVYYCMLLYNFSHHICKLLHVTVQH